MSNEITDEKLLTYLDGETDPRITAAIEASTEYKNRAAELAQQQNRLMTALYRHTCPESSELGELKLGFFSKKQARAIIQHAEECPHCTREIAQLREFLDEESPQPGSTLSDQIKVLVAQLISAPGNGKLAGTTLQTPAYGLRGNKQDAFVYEADGVQVIIDIQENAKSASHKDLLGIVTGLEAQAYRINLTFEGKTVADSQIDEAGNFVVSEIPLGEYKLRIIGPDVEIQILRLKI